MILKHVVWELWGPGVSSHGKSLQPRSYYTGSLGGDSQGPLQGSRWAGSPEQVTTEHQEPLGNCLN